MPSIETCGCQIDVENGYIIIIGIYRPPSFPVESFIFELNRILSCHIVQNAFLTIIAGDMNINILQSESPAAVDYLSLMYSYNFLPAITKGTRFSSTGLPDISNLDHIFINKLSPFAAGIISIDLTDHFPTFIEFNLPFEKRPAFKKITSRPFSSANFEALKQSIMNLDWDLLLKINSGNTNVDEACGIFVDCLNSLYCRYFP